MRKRSRRSRSPTAQAPPLDPAAFKRKLDEVKIVEPPPVVENEHEQPLTITPEVVRSAVAANHAEVNLLEAPLTVQPEEMIPIEQLSDDGIDRMIDRLATRHVVRPVDRRAERARPSALDQSAPQFLSLYVGRNGQGTQLWHR